MALECTFLCPLPNGIHARPASAMEELARRFESDITLLNVRTGRSVSAKSVLAIVGADVRVNDSCTLTVSGPDEQDAHAALTVFLRDAFPHCDAALPVVAVPAGELQLPPCLRLSLAVMRRGTAAVPGIASGAVVRTGGFRIPPSIPVSGVKDVAAEQALLGEALQRLIDWYDQRIAAVSRGVENELLTVHRSMARDDEFRRALLEAVAQHSRTAAGAIADVEAHFSGLLAASGNALLRERALDVQDLCLHLLRLVYGEQAGSFAVTLTGDSVVVAETLTPGQFLALDRRLLKGLVLSHAGTTSHTVILARSFGVPTLAGVAEAETCVAAGEEAVVDADLGVFVTKLDDRARRYYGMEQRRLAGRAARLRSAAGSSACTSDGWRLEIAANIGLAEEAGRAFESGAEGIGLFRTEMLFLDRDQAPTEQEQYDAYRSALEGAGGRPVIVRTVDIGGDKPAPYLDLPAEPNPFLGWRAVRMYPAHESLFRTQVRALVRASAHGRLRVMIPMVSVVDELRWVRGIVKEEQARCAAEGVAFDTKLQVGAMIEVPSVAFAMDHFCREADFFSIGTNDLLQYFLAADRGNQRVAALSSDLTPSFWRLLRHIVGQARENGRWIGLCGELGGRPELLPLLVGLGLDEISMSTPRIADQKAALGLLSREACVKLLDAVCGCATVAEASQALDAASVRAAMPLFDVSLVDVDGDCRDKAEVIKTICDRFFVHGRTNAPRLVEEAVWAREAVYSTGFGHGFAIPHCKTNAVAANSLAVLRLRDPVEWGSLDGAPVRVVVLLAIRESDQATEHMRIFSRLARQVMNEEFRERLASEGDPAALCAFLAGKIGAG
jgi:multiphosphoryl transfer protein